MAAASVAGRRSCVSAIPRIAMTARTASGARRCVTAIMTVAMAAGTNCDGNSLYNPSMVVANRVHSVVDRKVPADQVSSHSGMLLGQRRGGIVFVRLIFAVVHPNNASISGGRGIGAVVWIWPMAAVAETYKTID
jgi:hypothetical protein